MTTTPLPYPQQKRWISRHPVATVLIALGAAASLLGIFIGTVFVFVFGLLKNAEPTKVALARAQSSAEVVQQIGSPLRLGWLISGSINENGGGGKADLEIPVIGPRGRAEIYVTAYRDSGRWIFLKLTVVVQGSDHTIDLLQKPAPAP